MLIKYAQPVEGRRELICKGDEARVSRIRAPASPYDGMVERLQPVESKKMMDPRFFFLRSDGQEIPVCSSTLHYHYYKFLSLVAAKSMFPDHFCNGGELRVFRRKGELQAATYSEFVDDENGVIERRGSYIREFYRLALEPGDSANLLKRTMNERERQLNPDLARLERETNAAGIELAHPECNYHLSHGLTVFFETRGIDIRRSSGMAVAAGNLPAFEIISLLQALEILRVSRQCLARECEKIKPFRKEILDTGLEEIHHIVNSLMTNTIFGWRVFESNEFGKWGLRHWRDVISIGRNSMPRPNTFELIDPKAYLLLMEDLEQRLNP